jgi:peptidoglycan pentaglycine glycine transferase (the first glycine)
MPAGPIYTTGFSRSAEDETWDRFVARCPGGHHEQTTLWGRVKSHYGWRPVRGVVTRNGELVGGFQLLTKSIKRIGKIGYLSRGPVSIDKSPAVASHIADAVDRAARREGIHYLVVVPSYQGDGLNASLVDRGFQLKPDYLPPTGLSEATLLLDLGLDNEKLLAHMRPELRRILKNTDRRSITIKDGGEQDVEVFRRLMWALCERRGTAPTPPQEDFFHHIWNAFHSSGAARFIILAYEGRPIAGALLFTFGDSARLWKVGWDGDQAKRYPTQLLWWEAILRAKKSGFRYFDIVGIDRAHAQAILREEHIPSSKEYGMTFFKTSFGGQVVLLPEVLCKIYNPVFRFVIDRWGRQIMSLKMINRAAYV